MVLFYYITAVRINVMFKKLKCSEEPLAVKCIVFSWSQSHRYWYTGRSLGQLTTSWKWKSTFSKLLQFSAQFKKCFVYLSLSHWIPATLDFLFNIVYFGLIIVCDTVEKNKQKSLRASSFPIIFPIAENYRIAN